MQYCKYACIHIWYMVYYPSLQISNIIKSLSACEDMILRCIILIDTNFNLIITFLLFLWLKWKDTRPSSVTGTVFCHTFVAWPIPCFMVDIKKDFLQASNILQVILFYIIKRSRIRNKIRRFESFFGANGDRGILKVTSLQKSTKSL